ncbi:MAG TPA: AtpZ/AtpI family protein [Candidatus Omnitrophota bacterium]|nr:AtpZ/AtpI family protein [Candidatus Omnitrophota bacterium]HPN65924.1 AtpZ/AtpI family protein [Candidatus Omnitrophota bacterium]HRZ66539.1 AtpZ/AtpI family protein [Candidatus Omnitrophota bacterium]
MREESNKKAEFYKLTKVWGLLSFVPVVLAAGPLAGYFLGEFLEKKIGFAPYLSLVFMGLGFYTSVREIIKILKIIHKDDRNQRGTT